MYCGVPSPFATFLKTPSNFKTMVLEVKASKRNQRHTKHENELMINNYENISVSVK
jgi:hypothetical protein